MAEPGGRSGSSGGGGRDAGMAGAASEARFAGLSLVQLNELLEDEGQLTEMVQKMEEVSPARRRGLGAGGRGGLGRPRAQAVALPQVGLRGLGRDAGGLRRTGGEGTRPETGSGAGRVPGPERAGSGARRARAGTGALWPRLRRRGGTWGDRGELERVEGTAVEDSG